MQAEENFDISFQGGGELSQEEVRRRQAEQYRRDKFARTVRSTSDIS